MATANRRRISWSRCFAKTTAARINCRSPAASSMAHGEITNPAAPLKRRWSAGARTAAEPQSTPPRLPLRLRSVPKCDGDWCGFKIRNARGTNRARISRSRLRRRVHGYMSAADGERRTISRSAGSAVAPAPASNVNDHRNRIQTISRTSPVAGAYSYKYPTGFPSVRSGRISFRVMI